ncbi:hypothetical protein BASA81_002149 [Batrachochytrium salamandrivorans]|nr:hypothetical protein BASA81_002149 [Batrachochytrium salamandrivorans]
MDQLLEQIKQSNEDETARFLAWDELNREYFFEEARSNPCPNISYCVERGFLDSLYDELDKPGLIDGSAATRALSCFSHVSLNSLMAKQVSQSGLVSPLMTLASQHPDGELGDLALTGLGSMALHPENYPVLMCCGVLRLALKYLHYMTSDDERDIDFGLTAASLLIRLVGKDESGKGFDAIQGNKDLLEETKSLLELVLDGGEDGVVYGYSRDPANIILDISVLATSDGNKPLLAEFIPLILRAMEERPDNERMLKYAVVALSQLAFDTNSQPVLLEHEERVLDCLNQVISKTRKTDKETFRTASVLRATIESGFELQPAAPAQEPARKPSIVAQLVRRVSAATPPPSKPKHVMISYQWDVQPIAKALEAALSKNGIKTWFDLNDMGSNINDSMAEAVEGSYHIVVLFSRKYKESGNCRKECEMGDNGTRAMTFVKVQPDYTPEGVR